MVNVFLAMSLIAMFDLNLIKIGFLSFLVAYSDYNLFLWSEINTGKKLISSALSILYCQTQRTLLVFWGASAFKLKFLNPYVAYLIIKKGQYLYLNLELIFKVKTTCVALLFDARPRTVIFKNLCMASDSSHHYILGLSVCHRYYIGFFVYNQVYES